MPNYEGLEASLYDYFWEQELDDQPFFHWLLEKEPRGKMLELGSGTGRLLIPFRLEGWDVEGVDASEMMITLCRRKAKAAGVEVTLHQMLMEQLDLPGKYRSIFIPGFSFQMIGLRREASQALERFRRHMEPGGQLLISMFIPWGEIGSDTDGLWRLRKQAVSPDNNQRAVCHEAYLLDRDEQLMTVWNRYELFGPNGAPLDEELREMKLRWYFKNEFLDMLHHAGFRGLETYGDFRDERAAEGHATITYKAINP